MDKANINEPLDLQEATRRDDVYNQLNEIIDKLRDIPCFPSLLWAWTFDILREIHENYQGPQEFNDEMVPEGITLKQIFDKLWDDCDDLGLNMDHGGEVMEEVIRDWMRENDFLVSLEDDSWLDEAVEPSV